MFILLISVGYLEVCIGVLVQVNKLLNVGEQRDIYIIYNIIYRQGIYFFIFLYLVVIDRNLEVSGQCQLYVLNFVNKNLLKFQINLFCIRMIRMYYFLLCIFFSF